MPVNITIASTYDVLISFFYPSRAPRVLHSFPTRRSSDLASPSAGRSSPPGPPWCRAVTCRGATPSTPGAHCSAPRWARRSEEHTSELQSHVNLVCRLLLEKKKKPIIDSSRLHDSYSSNAR